MESWHIIKGFSEIKLELIRKCGLNKMPHELGLWFSYKDGVLYTHDFDDHEKSMAIAVWSCCKPKIYFKQYSYEWNLTDDVIKEALKKKIDVDEEFNDRFKLFGYLIPRRGR